MKPGFSLVNLSVCLIGLNSLEVMFSLPYKRTDGAETYKSELPQDKNETMHVKILCKL
jgi:hypothetical protein